MFQKGFTLLEVIAAIFVLTLGISGPFALVEQLLVSASLAQDKLLASYLAQEGVEIVRNIRDSNWIDPSSPAPDWDNGLYSDANPATPYIFYNVPISLYFDSSDTQVLLYSDSYVQGGGVSGSNSGFFRFLYLDPICNDASGAEKIADKGENVSCGQSGSSVGAYPDKVGIRVISEVHWPSETSNKKVIIEDRLYDWQVL